MQTKDKTSVLKILELNENISSSTKKVSLKHSLNSHFLTLILLHFQRLLSLSYSSIYLLKVK